VCIRSSGKDLTETDAGGFVKPQADQILRTIASTLITQYLPGIEKEHEKAELGISAILMMAAAEEFDRAAHRRIVENHELRRIFAASLSVIKGDDLKRRVKEASEKEEENYHISVLDKVNCELQEVFIELHTHIEALEGEGARKIHEAIWTELENWTKRREFTIWEVALAMLTIAATREEGQ
jgi:hypothetical protein